MEETMIWVTGLIAEILLVGAAVFAVVRRSRKSRQQLLAQLASQEKHPEEPVATEISAATPGEIPDAPSAKIELSEIEAEPSAATDTPVTNEFDQLLVSLDNAKLDESVGRLRQGLEATTRSLQRLASDLQQNPTSSGQGHPEVESLQMNVLEMTQEVDSLQQSNAQLQQDLRLKAQAMELTAAKGRDHEEMVLQNAKKLRDKLKDSESDVRRLQSEKEALAREFAVLNKEYERIYSKNNQ